MCYRQIAAQGIIFIAAGYETTALALVYCIYLLSIHPDKQAKLLHEVDQFKGEIAYEDLESFPYTAAIINESIRLYPPAGVLARACAEDVKVHSAVCSFVSRKKDFEVSGFCQDLFCMLKVVLVGTVNKHLTILNFSTAKHYA